MAFRAAALTSAAIDLAQEAAHQAPRAVAVAGVLGPTSIREIDRLAEEYAHARGEARRGRRARSSSRAAARPRSIAGAGRRAPPPSPAPARPSSRPGPSSKSPRTARHPRRRASPATARALRPMPRPTCSSSRPTTSIWRPIDRAGCAVRIALRRPPRGGTGTVGVNADLRRLVDAGARVIGGGPGTAWPHVAALARARPRRGRVLPLASRHINTEQTLSRPLEPITDRSDPRPTRKPRPRRTSWPTPRRPTSPSRPTTIS